MTNKLVGGEMRIVIKEEGIEVTFKHPEHNNRIHGALRAPDRISDVQLVEQIVYTMLRRITSEDES